jgi:predicted phage terminase large subunit-like protein
MDENYKIYVLDTLKGHWKVAESIDNIFTMYQKWHPSVIGLETIAYQKALKSWLEEKMRERGVFFPITELRRNTNESKEFRIKALEPFYRDGLVYHAPWMKSLETELLQFPKGKHDDEIDALASQLDLLVPGDSQASEGIPSGSWEAAFLEARKFNTGHNDFFHEVANGR